MDHQDAAAAALALVAETSSSVGAVRVATIGSLAAVVFQPLSGHSRTAIVLRQAHTLETSLVGCSGKSRAANAVAGGGGLVLPHHARQSWIQGRLALRCAVAGTTSAVVNYDELGALALLADIRLEQVAADPDVKALASHAET